MSEAYEEGYRAYKDDKCLDDNPYCATLQEAQWLEWKAGYFDAGWDD